LIICCLHIDKSRFSNTMFEKIFIALLTNPNVSLRSVSKPLASNFGASPAASYFSPVYRFFDYAKNGQ
jgi:hypothetical protein